MAESQQQTEWQYKVDEIWETATSRMVAIVCGVPSVRDRVIPQITAVPEMVAVIRRCRAMLGRKAEKGTLTDEEFIVHGQLDDIMKRINP